MGAKLSSFTEKELTGFSIDCFSEDAKKSLDILGDIVLNSEISEVSLESLCSGDKGLNLCIFQQSVQKEKENISRLIEAEANDKEKLVMNHLFTVAFQETSLQMPVLGTEESIAQVSTEVIVKIY